MPEPEKSATKLGLCLPMVMTPGENRKAQKAARLDRAANSFEVVAREWFAKFKPNWVEAHSDKVIRRLERDMFPWCVFR